MEPLSQFREYDSVRLIKPIDDKIPVGTIGAILIDHKSDPPAYEVEFISETGVSFGVTTVVGDHLEKA